jgi:hypothetical protein
MWMQNPLILHPYLFCLIHSIVMLGASLNLVKNRSIASMSIIIVINCHILSVFIPLISSFKHLTTGITLCPNNLCLINRLIIGSLYENLPCFVMSGGLGRPEQAEWVA